MAGLLDFAQSASNAIAGNVSAPVDGIAWLMRKLGLPIPKDPVGGSNWLEDRGLTRQVPQSAASLAGETVGLLAPTAIMANAPKIAQGLLKMADNAAIPRALNPQAGVIGWHGSPHVFDKFKSEAIGTGEGAQAYGHGLYFAESPEVANIYRKNLTQSDDYVDGQLLDSTIPKHFLARVLNDESGNVGAAKDSLTAFAMPGGSRSVADSAKQALKLLEAGHRPTIQTIKPEGSLYKVDIPDEAVARFLDWDKPLSQQAQRIQSFARASGADLNKAYGGVGGDGSNLMKLLSQRIGSPDKASELLKQAGIPGIRYLDGGSRGAGQGSSNFVVFDPELIRILERNGQATGNIPWQPGEWRGLLGNN